MISRRGKPSSLGLTSTRSVRTHPGAGPDDSGGGGHDQGEEPRGDCGDPQHFTPEEEAEFRREHLWAFE